MTMDNIETATRDDLYRIAIMICKERYPREIGVLDQFIERGATIEITSNALWNKFGLTPKSMWLIRYAEGRINQRNLNAIVRLLNENEILAGEVE